jgi:hypothetical protein
MARDAQAIALHSFAQAHATLPEFPALCPAAVPLALPSIAPASVFPSPVVQWVSVSEALDDVAPVLTLSAAVLPMAFSSFTPDDSVRRWLSGALPLALAPFFAEAEAAPVNPATLPVVAEVTEDAPVVEKTRKPKATEVTEQDKTPRERSPKSIARTTAAR